MKYFLILIAILFASPFIYTGSYFLIEIRPHLAEIDQKIQTYRSNSPNHQRLKAMAESEESTNGIMRYASHSLARIYIKKNYNGLWNILGLHWLLWMSLLYSDDDMFSLWMAMIPYKESTGMYDIAQSHFAQDFDSLTCHQLAQLAVMVRSQVRFSLGSEKAEQRIKERGIERFCRL